MHPAMSATRLSKLLLVAALALTCSLVVFGNVVDPAVNLSFVQHVLSMDTVLPRSGITDRSITDPVLQRTAFGLIVAGEALTAFLLWLGAALMARHLRSPVAAFAPAHAGGLAGRRPRVRGWPAGGRGGGGAWFGMWMSKDWNGQDSAFRFAMTVLGVLIYVALPETPEPA